MQDTQSFAPEYKKSVTDGSTTTNGTLLSSVTVTANNSSATASTAIPGVTPNTNTQIQIANKSTSWAHVNFGVLRLTVTEATVATGYPVAPGAVVVVTVDPEVDGASVILDAASTGSSDVIFTRGGGV